MDENIQKFQQQLVAFKRRFVEDLPRRLASLEEDWIALRNGKDQMRLERLHRDVHSLAGSGGTFGAPEVSRVARALEIPLKEYVGGKTDWPANGLASLEGLWLEFKNVCRQTSAGEHAAAPEHVAAPEHDLAPEPAERPAPERPTREVVVVTDDDAFFAQFASRLESFAYAPKKRPSLDSALDEGSRKPLALILDDERVPLENLDGESAWRQREIPLLVISRNDDMESRLRAVRLGAEEFLVKPADMGQILDKLETLSLDNPNEPFRVLIVDDDEIMAEHNATLLRENGMQAEVLTDPMRVLDVLDEFHAELVILDVFMPGCSGPEVAAVIRQKRQFMGMPILFLSGEIELKAQYNAVSKGGDDFLIKPIEPEHMLRAVSNRVKRYRAVHAMMVCDSLTGLLNHTNMKQQIRSELDRLGREAGMVALAMIDLDKFKNVNDTYGHPAGDVVLKNLSRFLTQRLRRTDIVGRMGGEEFAVLLRGITSRDEAVAVMEKLRIAFSELRHTGDWGDIAVTFSCGMAFSTEFPYASALSSAADMALYEAKHAGRNRVAVHTPPNKA